MEAPKPEEIFHPPMDQLEGLEYCIDSNPSWERGDKTLCLPLSSGYPSAMEAPKPEEIFHPPMDQLEGLEYCIDSNPSWGEGGYSSRVPTLHLGIGDCCDDSNISCSFEFDGWN